MPPVQRTNKYRNTSNRYSIVSHSQSQGSASQNQNHQGRQIWSMPIPPVDPRESAYWNDEIDMYMPRKHVLSKYKFNSELLENVCVKPYPISKIILPDLFPEATIDGVRLSDKTKEIVQKVSQRDYLPESRTDNGLNYKKLPKLTDEEEKELKSYLHPMIEKRLPFFFTFGDQLSLNMYEHQLEEELKSLENDTTKMQHVKPLINYKIDKINLITNKYNKFSAKEFENNEKFVDNLENDLKKNYKISIKDLSTVKYLSSNSFEDQKVSISLEDYKDLKLKKEQAESNIYAQDRNYISNMSQQQQQQHQLQQQQQHQQAHNVDGFENSQFDMGLWPDDNNENALNNFNNDDQSFNGFF